MESPSFCGQTCHTPMHPQFTAWQDAPHSQVACVQCHIGEGGHAFVKYKLNGVRQLYHVVTGQLPATDSRRRRHASGASRCAATCHWSGKGFGDVIRVKREYADDEAEHGDGDDPADVRGRPWRADVAAAAPSTGTPIHACASSSSSRDAERQTIPFVKVHGRAGQRPRIRGRGHDARAAREGHRRTMDCVDCHNVVAHRVAPTPEQAVDAAIAAGRIDRGLPFVRREGVRLMKSSLPDQ